MARVGGYLFVWLLLGCGIVVSRNYNFRAVGYALFATPLAWVLDLVSKASAPRGVLLACRVLNLMPAGSALVILSSLGRSTCRVGRTTMTRTSRTSFI